MRRWVITIADREIPVEIREVGEGRLRVTWCGRTAEVDACRLGRGRWSLLVDGTSVDAAVTGEGDDTVVAMAGRTYRLRTETSHAREARGIAPRSGESGSGETARSVMPGIVTRVLVARGEVVEAGEALVILEAMKMENEIRAVRGGTVEEVFVTVRQTVNAGEPLVRLG